MDSIPILTYPDPFLSKACKPVREGQFATVEPKELKWGWIDDKGVPIIDRVFWIIRAMTSALYATPNGIGLAAPQAGFDMRMFIMSTDRSVDPIVIINPVLSEPRGEALDTEGCLSLPGVEAKVKRAESILVSGTRPSGEGFSFRAEGLIARICQHEVDHLDGKLFIDRLSMMARKKIDPSLESLRFQYKRWKERQDRAKASGESVQKTEK